MAYYYYSILIINKLLSTAVNLISQKLEIGCKKDKLLYNKMFLNIKFGFIFFFFPDKDIL